MFKKIFLFFFSFSAFIFTQNLYELNSHYQNSENVWGTAYCNKSLYVGTSPLGTIYKITSPDKDSLLIENIFHPDFSIEGPKFIQTLISIGHKVYAAASNTPYLLSINCINNSLSIVKDSYSILNKNNITALFDATFYQSKDQNHIQNQYIYFAAIANDKLSFVKWKIDDKADSIEVEKITLLNPQNQQMRQSYDIEIGKYTEFGETPREVIYIGSYDDANNYVTLWDIKRNVEIKSIRLPDGYLIRNFKADKNIPNRLLLFNDKITLFDVTKPDQPPYIIVNDGKWNGGTTKLWNDRFVYNFLDSDLYTNRGILHTYDNFKNDYIEYYDNWDNLFSNCILPVKDNEGLIKTFGATGGGLNPIYLYEMDSSNKIKVKSIPHPVLNKPIGPIRGLAIFDDTVYASQYINRIEATLHPNQNWIIKDINDDIPNLNAVQSDKMIVWNSPSGHSYMLYGLYSSFGPFLKIRDLITGEVWGDTLSHKITGLQVRINEMIISLNNILYLGTGTSNTTPTSPYILRMDLLAWEKEKSIIRNTIPIYQTPGNRGKQFINSIATRSDDNFDYVYSTIDHESFSIIKVDKEGTLIDSSCFTSTSGKFFTSIFYDNNFKSFIVTECERLYIIPDSLINSSADIETFTSSPYGPYWNLYYPETKDSSHRFAVNIIKSTKGKYYCFNSPLTHSLFEFEISLNKNLGIPQPKKFRRVNVPDYISVISNDYASYNEKGLIYIGTVGGRIYAYSNNK